MKGETKDMISVPVAHARASAAEMALTTSCSFCCARALPTHTFSPISAHGPAHPTKDEDGILAAARTTTVSPYGKCWASRHAGVQARGDDAAQENRLGWTLPLGWRSRRLGGATASRRDRIAGSACVPAATDRAVMTVTADGARAEVDIGEEGSYVCVLLSTGVWHA